MRALVKKLPRHERCRPAHGTAERALELQDRAIRAIAEADEARSERERIMLQMREANEQLVLACLRADELAEEAGIARAVAAQNAAVEAQRRERAEALATQLLASEDALRARERRAQTTSRAMLDFLAMLGHELRNPLAPILLALDLIARDRTDPHDREHSIIERQVAQLVRLVEDLLDVARIRSGKVELRREPVEAAELVARAVETATPLIESKRHTLVVDVPPHGLTIHGDVLRLTQVVGNLVTNAAKYTPSGGTITVTAERRADHVVLRVRDTGIGISEAMLPRIFDVFSQEQQRSGRAPGGLGLGLAIVRSIVELHGGTVAASSAGLGRGSELVVELPVGDPRSDDARRQPRPPVDVAAARSILIVDDDHATVELAGRALRSLGHEVRTAFDAVTALSIVEQFVPDVVLLDIDLGGQDGYELADRLRAAVAPHEVHFIAVTGHGQAADRQRSADAKFDDHLVKPVDLATLEASVERATHG